MFSRLRAGLVASAVLALSALPVSASEVILTIDGEIAGGAPVDMTREDLEALGSATIVTRTPWSESAVTFEGVPFKALLDRVGATGDTLAVVALNNYRSELPLADIEHYGVILALKQDGAYMPVSDKGPLFIVYPFDSDAALDNEVYYARSAWQVRSITVE
ncbi:oxidoreductase [Hoeflea sp. BAL378]|uniref:molybdopterin-dependent oxidoreductase n=1 Tax=Hoeflea sp. BAL378 TaxID=1547437 RepID=UPI000513B760|nr:molybdopterin-dependent oxidoreductase [Hoeflea sp. BAL378]KGF69254.1 oxidoreductase [Hoeflea sp. BAL378]